MLIHKHNTYSTEMSMGFWSYARVDGIQDSLIIYIYIHRFAHIHIHMAPHITFILHTQNLRIKYIHNHVNVNIEIIV